MAHPSEIPASERGIVAPVQPEHFGRRTLFQRAAKTAGEVALATGAVSLATNLWLPHEALGARRPTEPLVPLTTDARIAQATRRLEAMREKRFRLPVVETAGAIPSFEQAYPEGFKPGDRIDRGIAQRDAKRKKRLYVRVDDFWWEQQGHDYVDQARALRIPLTALPVEGAITLYPNLMLKMAQMKVFFGNHGQKHDPDHQWNTLTYPEIVADMLPNMHALNNLNDALLTSGQQVVNELFFVGPPYGAGAQPGEPYSTTDKDVKRVAKNSRSGILGWTIDTQVWADGITEDQMFENVRSQLVPGAIIINHPDENGMETRVMPRWVGYARAHGYEFHPLTELKHSSAVGT